MAAIRCGHTYCKTCIGDFKKCPTCHTVVRSAAVNTIIQGIINDFKDQNERERLQKMEEQTRQYVDEYQSLVLRFNALNGLRRKECIFSVNRGPLTPRKRDASQFEECRRRTQIQRMKNAFRTFSFRSEPTIGDECLRRSAKCAAEAPSARGDLVVEKKYEDLIHDFVPDCLEHIQDFHHYRSDLARINSGFKLEKKQRLPSPSDGSEDDATSDIEDPRGRLEKAAGKSMPSQPSFQSIDSNFSGTKPPVTTPNRRSRGSSVRTLVYENRKGDKSNHCPHGLAPFHSRFPHLKASSLPSSPTRQRWSETATPPWQQYRVLCDAFRPNNSPQSVVCRKRYPNGYKRPKFASTTELEYYIHVVSEAYV
ncbi:uncharacterized protein [Montipora capricornis]|uniref:uncharacterized protein n=1 Tax=Montipora capricornis TaxID=246305 RepID=UPI0035F1ED41